MTMHSSDTLKQSNADLKVLDSAKKRYSMNKFNYDNRPHKVIKFLVFSIFLISTCNKIRSATITITVFIIWPRDSLISVSALGPVTKSWHN